MKLASYLALPLLAVAAASSVRAEDLTRLSLEDLLSVDVEGASRYAQPISEAPATTTVIEADDIRRYGYTQFSDALRMARGVYTSYDRTYTYLGVRGFSRPGDYNSRVLMLVDGARSNDTVYDQAMVGNEAPIALDWVKRIEFVPGPASALYGGNALFGVANAVLWSGADLNGSRISAETGSAGTLGINALSGRQLEDGSDWVAGVSARRRGGENLYYPEFEAAGIPDGKARGLDGERYFKAFAKYSKHGWRFLATYSNRYKDVPTAYYGTVANARGTNTRDEHLHLDITNSTALSQNWSQLAHMQLGAYTFRADYVYPSPTPLNRDYTLNTWWDAEYQLTYTGFNAHKLLFGSEVRRSPHMDQYNYDVTPANSVLNDQRSSTATGLYVQDEWRISSRWLANLGGRLDHVSDAGTFGSPRLALIYQPQAATTAKFIYGRAFRAPNAYERFYTIADFSQGNANLKPERIETKEISLEHALTPAMRLGLSHYRYTIHNLIDQIVDGNGVYQYINLNDMRAHGWELEAESLIGLGWRVRGSVAWQRVEQDSGESINSPHRLGKLFVDGPIFDGWTGAFELQAMSRRQAMVGSIGGNAIARMTLRQSRQGPYGQWSVVVNNLANRAYSDPSSLGYIQNVLPQDTRQWLIRWEYAL